MTWTGRSGPCRSRTICPGTPSRRNWRCTARPSCCGVSRPTATGSGPSRRTRSPTCSPGTWASPRACCPTTPSGGTRAKPGRWWPCGGPRRCGRWPCNGRRSSLPPGFGCPCPGWSSSARRHGRPGSTPPWNGPPARSSSSTAPGLQRLPGRKGLPRQPPLPRTGGTDTRILLPVLLLPYRRQPGPVEAAPRQPASVMGGIGWKG